MGSCGLLVLRQIKPVDSRFRANAGSTGLGKGGGRKHHASRVILGHVSQYYSARFSRFFQAYITGRVPQVHKCFSVKLMDFGLGARKQPIASEVCLELSLLSKAVHSELAWQPGSPSLKNDRTSLT